MASHLNGRVTIKGGLHINIATRLHNANKYIMFVNQTNQHLIKDHVKLQLVY